eukprot:3255240-Heterocapsa_arctica.AAC.1
MPPVALPRRDQSRGRAVTAEDRHVDCDSPHCQAHGGVDSYPNPARVMGPSGAGYSTSPTPFAQVSAFNPMKWTTPGDGNVTGAGPTQTSLGAQTGASYSTGQAPS